MRPQSRHRPPSAAMVSTSSNSNSSRLPEVSRLQLQSGPVDKGLPQLAHFQSAPRGSGSHQFSLEMRSCAGQRRVVHRGPVRDHADSHAASRRRSSTSRTQPIAARATSSRLPGDHGARGQRVNDHGDLAAGRRDRLARAIQPDRYPGADRRTDGCRAQWWWSARRIARCPRVAPARLSLPEFGQAAVKQRPSLNQHAHNRAHAAEAARCD